MTSQNEGISVYKSAVLKFFCSQDFFALLKIIEYPKELWFLWIISIDTYYIRDKIEKHLKQEYISTYPSSHQRTYIIISLLQPLEDSTVFSKKSAKGK